MNDQTPREVLTENRPLFHLSNRELTAVLLQADHMLRDASESMDPTSLTAKIFIEAAFRMKDDAGYEIAQRN